MSLFENKKGRDTIRCLFSYLVPPSNHVTKQARNSSRPTGMNFPVYLLSVTNFGGFDMREQEPKAQVSKKTSNGTLTHNSYSG